MIEPNELQIDGPDYTIASLKSVEDCDKAINILADIIARIEAALGEPDADPAWKKKARKVLSLKKAARLQVYVKRKDFNIQKWKTWEFEFIGVVKSLNPDLFHEAVEVTNRKYPPPQHMKEAA